MQLTMLLSCIATAVRHDIIGLSGMESVSQSITVEIYSHDCNLHVNKSNRVTLQAQLVAFYLILDVRSKWYS